MIQSRIDRIRYFTIKKVVAAIHGLRPSGLSGRFKGPKVLVNSIPKAGTHLVESALEKFPLLRNAAERTLRGWECIAPKELQRVTNIPRGLFRTGHLPAHPEVLDVIKQNNISVIFVIRDPRDIVLSNYKYATYIDQTHPTNAYFKSLPSDEARLLKTIIGEPGILTPIAEILDLFEPWLTNENTVVVRFEDLVGVNGGGHDECQFASVKSIAHHLGIYLDDAGIQEITSNIFQSKSLTFRNGQIGKWKTAFSENHIRTFQKTVGNRSLRYGYVI